MVPGQRLGPIAKQGGDWRTDLAEFVYESPVEVGEPEESLQLLDRLWLWSALNGHYLPLVHRDAMLVDDITEEGYNTENAEYRG